MREREFYCARVLSCMEQNTENRKQREKTENDAARHKKQNKTRIIYITERQNKEFF